MTAVQARDNRSDTPRRHRLQQFAYWVVLILWIAPIPPAALATTTVVVTAVSVVNRVVDLATGRRLYPLIAWEVGFLTIIAPEMFDVLRAPMEVPTTVRGATLAAQLLCSCHALVVLVAEAVARSAPRRARIRTRPSPPFWHGRNVLVVLTAVASAGVFWVPLAVSRGLNGRVGTEGVDEGPVQALGLAAALLLPGVATVRLISSGISPLLRAYLWALPVLAIAFLSGSRNVLLFAGTVPAAIVLILRGSHKVHVARLVVLVGLLIPATAVMSAVRTTGLNNAQLSDVLHAGENVSLDQNEGVTHMTARMVDLFDHEQFREGASAFAVTFFWIPRSVWPGKPPLLGWWLPREMGDGGFSAGHSASVGYPGEGYADFGVIGAFAWSALVGSGAGALCRLVARAQVTPDKWVLVAGMAYPAMYFAVRSPVTTSITVAGVAAWVALLRSGTISPPDATADTVGTDERSLTDGNERSP
ncbi:O-antigen polymerase [Krasilnikovia sp. MM14-A1259]|uniref:O-antigen polymerase n=1 Tax=Krasilnikovia sp. MM14-A1259 TaxID=3373539 RepID=UPI0037F862C0